MLLFSALILLFNVAHGTSKVFVTIHQKKLPKITEDEKQRLVLSDHVKKGSFEAMEAFAKLLMTHQDYQKAAKLYRDNLTWKQRLEALTWLADVKKQKDAFGNFVAVMEPYESIESLVISYFANESALHEKFIQAFPESEAFKRLKHAIKSKQDYWLYAHILHDHKTLQIREDSPVFDSENSVFFTAVQQEILENFNRTCLNIIRDLQELEECCVRCFLSHSRNEYKEYKIELTAEHRFALSKAIFLSHSLVGVKPIPLGKAVLSHVSLQNHPKTQEILGVLNRDFVECSYSICKLTTGQYTKSEADYLKSWFIEPLIKETAACTLHPAISSLLSI